MSRASSTNVSTAHGRWRKSVLCLEADWWGDMNASATVRPILELAGSGWNGGIPFRHRDVATREELGFYLRKWTQKKYAGYPILYLAMHGSPGEIHLSDGTAVSLDELAQMLGPKCAKRIIHFGSCETVSLDRRHLQRFLRATGALALTGYREATDWMKSAAFEVLLLDAFQHNTATVLGMRAVERRIKNELGVFGREMGFRMVIRDG